MLLFHHHLYFVYRDFPAWNSKMLPKHNWTRYYFVRVGIGLWQDTDLEKRQACHQVQRNCPSSSVVSSSLVFCISGLSSVEFEDASETQLDTVLFCEGGHWSVAGH